MVANFGVSVDERQIGIHLGRIGVVTVEAPDTGFAVADGAEVERAVGFAEAEVRIGSFIESQFAGGGDDILGIHADAFDLAERLLLVGLGHLGNLRELLDAA